MTQTPPPQVWPTLTARDARGLIKFLVDAFGFEETAVYGEGDQVNHAELAWPPGGGVMLGSADPGSTAPGTFRGYAVCDDPDTLFKRAVEHGAAVDQGAHRPGLRLARVLGQRPGGKPLVVRYLPGPPALSSAVLV